MGHAQHFLARLERADALQCDRALSWYRDPEGVRFLLARTGGQTPGERVALSLDPADRGPYLVVSRTGEFITCLGPEMALSDLPLVSFAEVEAGSVALRREREREAAYQARPPGSSLFEVFVQLELRAERLTREEVMALTRLLPVLRDSLLLAEIQFYEELRQEQRGVLALLEVPDSQLRNKQRDRLLNYWQLGWAAAHTLTLGASGGPTALELETRSILSRSYRRISPTLRLHLHGFGPWGARATWCAGKLGRDLLPCYKEQLFDTRLAFPAQFDAVCALLTIACRHTKTRAEIAKALRAAPLTSMWDMFMEEGHRTEPAELIQAIFEDPEERIRKKLSSLRSTCVTLLRREAPELAAAYPEPEDVPESVALAVGVGAPAYYFLEGNMPIMHMMALTPLLARGEVEDLYFPARLVDVFAYPWKPVATKNVARVFRDLYGGCFTPQPVRAPARPGRNEPCSCGSGRKYKVCCGKR